MLPFDTHPLYAAAVAFVLGFGAISFPALFFVTAPYGRHARKGWGPTMPARWGWVVMEAPSPIGFAVVYFLSDRAFETVPLILFALWQLHYVYRSFIFPFRMRGGGKGKPILTVSLAVLFNLANGPMNAFAITELAPHLASSWLADPRFALGVAVFFLGWGMNHHADATLRNLRKPGETGYKIPHGGMYRFVSCPNYLGEIVEWCGFALAAWTPAAAAFAFFTFANLAPRAVAHHRWYHEKFEDYPRERRAILPFVW
ncbi:MAG TPA: DUF1295 domain-containing protein [Polyangiaceae bacterium LLY-WYZ-15_(1-7)]|nr:DUF1295 domain-containing protein [Polyangiaceae bacterium LLY-WYZ-15_(1-7)]HJL06681.1 DUF1295 domain-containing protein [Polyangiaceae bacterium LLY-WYZ-15_(1-7)]HJL07721.1 DUF1295 domain-containing protein [Polyangiaceae bacterium LLY-WYZ-15_(1-7)]HJL25345.1 DUF1295 domain-containing protein [Polyangiaceae bacterium LLY-WYZ-15_(1-7)]HJL39100.1 DUF1295 domain-containing protein [Polyangiaceae bacterium LLY-WYZ-15_(1-7)]